MQIRKYLLEEHQVGMLIGQRGETIKRIRALTNAQIDNVRDRELTVIAPDDQTLQQVLSEIQAEVGYLRELP